MVKDFSHSQANFFFIKNTNEFLQKYIGFDIIGFYEALAAPCITPNFATMQLSEAFSYDGTMIATTLNTAHKLIGFPASKNKLFYVWDLEWLRMPFKEYNALYSIYGNPELTLIARSQEHKRVLEMAWNRKVDLVIDNFDMEKLVQL